MTLFPTPAAILFALLPAAVAAGSSTEDLVQRYRPMVDTCWWAAQIPQARQDCSGLLYDTCSRGEPDGQATVGMAGCMAAEASYWDNRLNQEWGRVLPLALAADAQESDPGYAVRAEKLVQAQRAWITFRDAQCGYDHAVFGAGSLARVVYPSCLAEMTFDRVLDLVAIGADLGG